MLEGDLVHLWGKRPRRPMWRRWIEAMPIWDPAAYSSYRTRSDPFRWLWRQARTEDCFSLNRAAMWGQEASTPAQSSIRNNHRKYCPAAGAAPHFLRAPMGLAAPLRARARRLRPGKSSFRPVRIWSSTEPRIFPTIPGQTDGGEDPGFFTVISSNGTHAGSATIWAVGRPTTTSDVSLFAFNATASGGTLPLIFASSSTQRAGSWPDWGNANIVPVVANGKVYVASDNTLTIFGATPPRHPLGFCGENRVSTPAPPADLDSPHVVTGTLLAVNGATLKLQTRAGKTVTVDTSLAEREQADFPLPVARSLHGARIILQRRRRAAGDVDFPRERLNRLVAGR